MLNPNITQWYIDCLGQLSQYFPTIAYDDIALRWIMIAKYPLPQTFIAPDTTLLIETPGPNIDNHTAYNFYTNLNLTRIDGAHAAHLIDKDSYNPYRNQGYCRLSYHLTIFRPTFPAANGDSLTDICQSLFHFLSERW
jgi:hypothetical protein